MCEAPSTWRASTWSIWPLLRSAAYSGLIAAPGTPNAGVTPSFCMIATAASAAAIRAMSLLFLCVGGGVTAGQLECELQQAGVVEAAVAARHESGDELGDGRAERDDHA